MGNIKNDSNVSWILPDDASELFQEYISGIRQYNMNTIEPMDNVASMTFFLEAIDMDQINLYHIDGTKAIIYHDLYPFKIQIDAGGRDDFFSHKFELSEYTE